MIQAFLYELTQGETVFRWTSHDEDLIAAGETWLARDISHDKIAKTSDLSDSGTTLTLATTDADHPIRAFLAGAPVTPVRVRIFETFGDFTTTYLLHVADIQRAKFGQAGQIALPLTSILRAGDQVAPRVLVQTPCNWTHGESHTCRVDLASYAIAGTITSISGMDVTVNECDAEATARGDGAWFALGKLVAETEIRLIMRQAGPVLTLNAPFLLAEVGAAVTATPGCDRTFSTCGRKFANKDNYGGMPYLPTYNPLISAGVVTNENNGKKGNRSSK